MAATPALPILPSPAIPASTCASFSRNSPQCPAQTCLSLRLNNLPPAALITVALLILSYTVFRGFVKPTASGRGRYSGLTYFTFLKALMLASAVSEQRWRSVTRESANGSETKRGTKEENTQHGFVKSNFFLIALPGPGSEDFG